MTTEVLELCQKKKTPTTLWQFDFSSSRNGRREKNILQLFQSNWRFNLPSNFFQCNKGLQLLRMIFHIRVAQSAGGTLFHSNLVKFQVKRNHLVRDPISTMIWSTASAADCGFHSHVYTACYSPQCVIQVAQTIIKCYLSIYSKYSRYFTHTARIFLKYVWIT